MIQTFIGDYSLSFLRKGKVWHVPIKSRQHDNGAIRFYLVDQGGSSIDFNINRPKFDLKSHKGLIKTMICLNVHYMPYILGIFAKSVHGFKCSRT